MSELENVFDEDLELDAPDTSIVTDDDDVLGSTDDIFTAAPPVETKEGATILDKFLASNGITNGNIKFLDENDKETEKSFYDLTEDEQLAILSSFSQEAPEIDEQEQGFINYLRENNLSLKDFFDRYNEELSKKLTSQYEPNYDIDAYDDEELFLLDLKSKYNLTDDELKAELEKELQNETLFKKKVDSLRTEYKKLEDQYKETQQAEFARKREEEFNTFANTLVDVALKTPEFYGIELEDEEKNEVLSFLLDLDDTGASGFSKELNKPENLYRAAWFLKYGEQAFKALDDAYKLEIAKIKKDAKRVVIVDNKQKDVNNIHDLNF